MGHSLNPLLQTEWITDSPEEKKFVICPRMAPPSPDRPFPKDRPVDPTEKSSSRAAERCVHSELSAIRISHRGYSRREGRWKLLCGDSISNIVWKIQWRKCATIKARRWIPITQTEEISAWGELKRWQVHIDNGLDSWWPLGSVCAFNCRAVYLCLWRLGFIKWCPTAKGDDSPAEDNERAFSVWLFSTMLICVSGYISDFSSSSANEAAAGGSDTVIANPERYANLTSRQRFLSFHILNQTIFSWIFQLFFSSHKTLSFYRCPTTTCQWITHWILGVQPSNRGILVAPVQISDTIHKTLLCPRTEYHDRRFPPSTLNPKCEPDLSDSAVSSPTNQNFNLTPSVESPHSSPIIVLRLITTSCFFKITFQYFYFKNWDCIRKIEWSE